MKIRIPISRNWLYICFTQFSYSKAKDKKNYNSE
uniref:Uncharacterized protein n=1 Tax=Rhizophora mucronata TaxID=61149 RepID=A0A2P2QI58_RHIMU